MPKAIPHTPSCMNGKKTPVAIVRAAKKMAKRAYRRLLDGCQSAHVAIGGNIFNECCRCVLVGGGEVGGDVGFSIVVAPNIS